MKKKSMLTITLSLILIVISVMFNRTFAEDKQLEFFQAHTGPSVFRTTVGETVDLKPYLVFIENNQTTELAESAIITWLSTNTEVATISKEGVVTTIKSGKTTIEVSVEQDGKTYTKSNELTVLNKGIDNYSFDWAMNDKNKMVINEGKEGTAEIDVQIINQTIASESNDFNVSWKIEDETIAKVEGETSSITTEGETAKSATIQALKVGNTKLTATISNKDGDKVDLELQIEVKANENNQQDNNENENKEQDNNKDTNQDSGKNSNNEESGKESTTTQDETVANKVLAKTGESTVIFIGLIVVTMFSAIFILRYKKLKF